MLKVPNGSGVFSEEAEMFLIEHGGSVLTPDTWVNYFLSLEVILLNFSNLVHWLTVCILFNPI